MLLQNHLLFRFPGATYKVSIQDFTTLCVPNEKVQLVTEAAQAVLRNNAWSVGTLDFFCHETKVTRKRGHEESEGLYTFVEKGIHLFYYAIGLMEKTDQNEGEEENPPSLLQEHPLLQESSFTPRERALLLFAILPLNAEEKIEFIDLYKQLIESRSAVRSEQAFICKKLCYFEGSERLAVLSSLFALLQKGECFEEAPAFLNAVAGLNAEQVCYYFERSCEFFNEALSTKNDALELADHFSNIFMKLSHYPFNLGKQVLDLFLEFSSINLGQWACLGYFYSSVLSLNTPQEAFVECLELLLTYSCKLGYIPFKLADLFDRFAALSLEEKELLYLDHPLLKLSFPFEDSSERYFYWLSEFAKIPRKWREEVLGFLTKTYGTSLYAEHAKEKSIVEEITEAFLQDANFMRQENLPALLSMVSGVNRSKVLGILLDKKNRTDLLSDFEPLYKNHSKVSFYITLEQMLRLVTCRAKVRKSFLEFLPFAVELLGVSYAQQDPSLVVNTVFYLVQLSEEDQQFVFCQDTKALLTYYKPGLRQRVLEQITCSPHRDEVVRLSLFLFQGEQEEVTTDVEILDFIGLSEEARLMESKKWLPVVLQVQEDLCARISLQRGNRENGVFSLETKKALFALLLEVGEEAKCFLYDENVLNILPIIPESKLLKTIRFLFTHQRGDEWLHHLYLLLHSSHPLLCEDLSLERLFAIPSEECFSLIRQLASFINLVDNLEARLKILFCLRNVAVHQRISVLEALTPFFAQLPQGMEEGKRIDELFSLAEAESPYVLPYLCSYLSKEKGDRFVPLFDVICAQPSYCMEMFCSFLLEKNAFRFASLCPQSFAGAVYISPEDYKMFVFSFFEEGFEQSQNVQGSILATSFIKDSFDLKKRSERHLHQVLEVLNEEECTEEFVEDLIRYAFLVKGEVSDELSCIFSLFTGDEDEEKIYLLKQILCAKDQVRKQLILLSRAFSESSTSQLQGGYILHLLRVAPTEMRASFIEELLQRKSLLAKMSELSVDFLLYPLYICPEGHSSYFAFLEMFFNSGEVEDDNRNVLADFFETYPEFVQLSHDYLANSLETVNERFWLQEMCMGILDYLPQQLQIYEEHPLYQTALRLRLSLLSEDGTGSKNPYKIYAQHQLWQQQSTQLVLPEESIEGKRVSISIQGMKAAAQERIFSFDDLPQDLGWNTLVGFFEQIDARIEAMSHEEHAAFCREILCQTTSNYEALKNNLLEDATIKELFRVKGKGEEKPPESLVGFIGILRYLCDLSPEVPLGRVLSPREEGLFAMSASIQLCRLGKKEGIALFYNCLDVKYKLSAKPWCETPSVEQAKTLLHNLVQTELLSALSDENLFTRALVLNPKERNEERKINQLSHQAGYIKNMIGQKVGLICSLSFDPYTNCLYDYLLTHTLGDVLEMFYAYFTPTFFVDAIQRAVERERTINKSVYTHICEFLDLSDAQDFEAVWDEEQGYAFTRKGALLLLLKGGYLEESLDL